MKDSSWFASESHSAPSSLPGAMAISSAEDEADNWRDVSRPWWAYDKQTAVTAIRGEQALRIAAQLLPRMNERAASGRNVKQAVSLLEEYRDPARVFDSAARVAQAPSWNDFNQRGRMDKLAPALRLALEMVSHEDTERRALEGELRLLEDAWREAEEIAAIADDLFLPPSISEKLGEIKGDISTR